MLAERAAGVRRAPTTSEALLWAELRGSRLGVGFRRQRVIGPYIVDFCAPRVRLVVEVDRGYHAERAGADARRDRWLEREGWRVLRLSAEEVLADASAAAAKVRAALG